MKHLLTILIVVALVVLPVSAGTWTTLGTNWNNWSGGPVHLYDHAMNGTDAYPVINMGDSGTGGSSKYQDNAANGCFWFQFDNNGGAYYSKMRIISQADIYGSQTFVCNGVSGTLTGYDWKNFSISGTGPVYCEMTTCSSWAAAGEMMLEYGNVPELTANFTAAPKSGAASLYVIFEDTSTNITGSETFNWTISPATGWLSTNLTSRDMTASFITPGNYTISHGVNNTLYSDTETKTDYITVYNATTDYITTGFAAMDEPRWVQLAGSTINLLDVENNSWKNTTASVRGYEEITTLRNHTISAYASMEGYADADLISQPAWNGGTYFINMYPEGYDNVSAGNVTLYVRVHGSDVLNVQGAAVNIAYNYGGSQQNNYAITDESGFGKFVVPNQTLIYIYAEKVGYARAGTTQNSGNGNGGDDRVTVEITLQRSYVTTTPTTTVTTIPGGGTPTPTVTVDPYPCDADHPENCKRKQTDMANILVQYGPMLVMFFIALTIIGGVKQIGR